MKNAIKPLFILFALLLCSCGKDIKGDVEQCVSCMEKVYEFSLNDINATEQVWRFAIFDNGCYMSKDGYTISEYRSNDDNYVYVGGDFSNAVWKYRGTEAHKTYMDSIDIYMDSCRVYIVNMKSHKKNQDNLYAQVRKTYNSIQALGECAKIPDGNYTSYTANAKKRAHDFEDDYRALQNMILFNN